MNERWQTIEDTVKRPNVITQPQCPKGSGRREASEDKLNVLVMEQEGLRNALGKCQQNASPPGNSV